MRTYLISLAGILGLGFLLAVSLVVSATLAALSSWSGAAAAVGETINFVASMAILTALFAMLFKWFPDTEVASGDVLPGAAATAVLFNLGKFAIGWYIGTQGLEFDLRRGRLHRRPSGLGLLRGAGRSVWRRTHPCLCRRAWIAARGNRRAGSPHKINS